MFENVRGKASRLCLELRKGGLAPLGFPSFLRAEKGGASLYRLPAFCHAESLIHAGRFFRKEKSSHLRVGYSLRRTNPLPPCIPLLTKRQGDSERSTKLALLAESPERSRTRSKLSASQSLLRM